MKYLMPVAAFVLTVSPALSASGAGPSEVIFLSQLVLLLITGRVLGEVMQRIGQPAVMGQLLAGVLLGPTVLGALWPDVRLALFLDSEAQKAMLSGVAQVGVLLLLLLTGTETDVRLVRKLGRASLAISVTGLSLPFACGYVLGELLPPELLPRPELRLITSLFLGTALAISSVKIVAMVVREMNFMRRDLGQVIISAAIIEDTIGWIIISVIFGIASHGAFDVLTFTLSIAGTLTFLVLSYTIGRPAVAALIRWVNDSFVSELPVITTILVVMGVMALASDAIGVHTVLGAFVAGMLIGQSPILTRHIDEQLRGLITAFFMPVFFAVAGLSADLTVLADPRMLALTAALLAIASIGKFSGAFVGGWLGGLSRKEALAVGFGMNARGSTEVIVATIGLSMGALSRDLYTMIVAMAVITTLAMPPTLRWALARIPLRESERERLGHEEREAQSFIAHFERLLLTVDRSANARFAAHIAGLIAGSRQILTTVLELDVKESQRLPRNQTTLESVVESVTQSAEAAAPVEAAGAASVSVAPNKFSSAGPLAPGVAVEREARKGYDLLVIGLDPTSSEDGALSTNVSEVAARFDGPLVIADGRGRHLDSHAHGPFSIMLPIRATRQSRLATELALQLALASHSPVDAFFVAERRSPMWRNPLGSSFAHTMEEELALREVVTMAEAYGVKVRTFVRHGSAAAVILQQLRRFRHDIVVLGVAKRSGEKMYFGSVAPEILRSAPCSVLVIAS